MTRTPQTHETPEQAQAADWLARLGNHAVSTETLREFREWRDHPANDLAYQEAEAVWEESGRHAADPEILRMTAAALARPRRRRIPWPAARPAAWSLALASLLVLGLALIFGARLAAPTYATGPGEQRLIRLADGSRVHLNVESRVRVRYGRGERRLELARGEALFDVAHDPTRPFVVRADGTDVRALGTRFDVRRRPGGVQVTLLEGVVRVERRAKAQPQTQTQATPQAWTLAPNQTLMLTAAGRAERSAADAAQATSWTTGRLAFRETPLAEAVAEVNRYGDRKVVLDGAALPARRVSGYFDVGDTEAFAQGVAAVFDLQAADGPGGTIVLREGGARTAGG